MQEYIVNCKSQDDMYFPLVLQSIPELNIPSRMNDSSSVASGIYWWYVLVLIHQLHIEVAEHHDYK